MKAATKARVRARSEATVEMTVLQRRLSVADSELHFLSAESGVRRAGEGEADVVLDVVAGAGVQTLLDVLRPEGRCELCALCCTVGLELGVRIASRGVRDEADTERERERERERKKCLLLLISISPIDATAGAIAGTWCKVHWPTVYLKHLDAS